MEHYPYIKKQDKDVYKALIGEEKRQAEGIELIRSYDHVVPGDLTRWLDYVGMTRTEFEETADTFRDPRVWARNEYGQWIKDNPWSQ